MTDCNFSELEAFLKPKEFKIEKITVGTHPRQDLIIWPNGKAGIYLGEFKKGLFGWKFKPYPWTPEKLVAELGKAEESHP